MNISLVCACKNRSNALRVSLSSWLLFDEVKEIIIVDWNSDEPINYLTKLDPRIKVVRVENQKYFNQPQPLNLAISLSTQEYIAKVDTDYVLNPYHNVFANYQIDDSSFLSGQHNFESPEYVDPQTGLSMFDRSKMSLGELNEYFNSYSPYFKYLTGFLFIKKENLLKVGGYNEILTKYYAFEDDEICKRLEFYGLEHKKINFDYNLIHLPHPDTKRFENFKGYDNSYLKGYVESLPNGLERWETEYYISQNHINSNKAICEKIVDYYSQSKTKWYVQQLDDQNFSAEIIPNKKLNGISAVYYVSLEESQSRRDNLECQFEHYGIQTVPIISKRFVESDDIVTGKYVDTLNEGTKGCVVSHLKAIKKWYEETDEDYGFFCEDDLSLETVEYWNFTWEDFIEKVPEDAECVQLLTIREDFDTFELRERYWDDWGATAYIVTRKYAKKLIDNYIKDDHYHLEIPNSNIMPLIENILFASVGKSYTYPLFVEEIKFQSTFVGKDDDVNNGQKNNHYIANQKVINWWKTKMNITAESLRLSKEVKTSPKIVDCFPYFNEKELLELRINLLKDYVDQFVIIESNYTFSGNPKPFTCKKTIEELQLPVDKIRVIEADLSEIGELSPYDLNFNTNKKIPSRERLQRDYICNYLDDYSDETVFIMSDCDEIINPENISFLRNLCLQYSDNIFKVPLVHLEGRADLRAHNYDETPHDWNKSMFLCMKKHLQNSTPSEIRSEFNQPYGIVYASGDGNIFQDLGWHFSWMGTPEDYILKFNSYSHHDSDLCDLLGCYDYKTKEDLFEYMRNYVPESGKFSPCGNIRIILRPYDISSLPKIIFDLPRVKQFLLPKTENKKNREQTELEKLLVDYSMDTENPNSNFALGVWYESNGHTAPALSYFLRCAERADDKDLAYESLIRSSYCYDKQGTRDGSAKSLLEQALCLCPKRPEAYYLLSRFAERKQWWQDCYIYANQGLMYADFDSQSLKTDVEYPGKYGLLFEKSISAWWWGKVDEAKSIILDVKNNYKLQENHLDVLNNNLKVMGVN